MMLQWMSKTNPKCHKKVLKMWIEKNSEIFFLHEQEKKEKRRKKKILNEKFRFGKFLGELWMKNSNHKWRMDMWEWDSTTNWMWWKGKNRPKAKWKMFHKLPELSPFWVHVFVTFCLVFGGCLWMIFGTFFLAFKLWKFFCEV